MTTPTTDNEPDQITRPAQYPTATRIEDGTAYDISGKALGPVNGQAAQDPFAALGATSAPAPRPSAPDPFIALGATAAPDPFAAVGATPAPAPQDQQPGYSQRLGAGLGLPTSVEQAKEMAKPSNIIAAGIAGPGPTILGGVYDYVKKNVQNFHDALNEQREALRNIEEGGPALANLGKGTLAILKSAVEAVPFIGDPTYTAGEDIAAGNLPGAAGGLTGAVAQVVLPELHERIFATRSSTRAIKAFDSASKVLESRTQEMNTMTRQASDAANRAASARAGEAAGTVTEAQRIDAENTSSAAAANAKKAQQALTEATETHGKAAVQVEQTARRLQRKSPPASEKQVKDNAAAREDFMRMAPPTKTGPAAYTPRDLDIARGYLGQEHQTAPINDVKGHYDALEKINEDIDKKVEPHIIQYGQEPITTNVLMDVRDGLEGSPQTDFVERGMKGLESYNLIDPTIAEADEIRADLNAQNRVILARDRVNVMTKLRTDPEFAARYHAAESLRNGIDGGLTDKGVTGIRQLRQDQASIIRVREAVENQLIRGNQVVRGSGQSGVVRKALQWSAHKAGIVAGAKLGGPWGAALGDIATEPTGRIGRMLAPGDLTRDELAARTIRQGTGLPTTNIYSAGIPSNPPSLEEPPVPSSGMTSEDMRYLARENTPLHSELATHYGEFSGNTSYGDLEQRFMQDIADKQRHGVALETPEKNILKQMNQANDTEVLAARKATEEQKVSAEEVPSATLPENAEPIMQMRGKMQPGMDTHRGLVHELAHAVVADEIMGDKLPNFGIRSHLHPENAGTQNAATVAFDWSKFLDEEGNIDPAKIENSINDLATVYVAGGVANDLYHDIPFTENHHLGTDLMILRRLMNKIGLSKIEQQSIVGIAGERAAEILSQPGVEDILHDHAAVREPGLDSKMHFSPERIQQVIQDLKGGTNAESGMERPTGAGKSNRELGEGTSVTGREGTPGQPKVGTEERMAKTVQQKHEGHAEGKAEAEKVAAGSVKSEPVNPALVAERPELTHRVTSKDESAWYRTGEVRADSEQEGMLKNQGLLKYNIEGDEAHITASGLAPEFRGQGLGTEMYERAAKEARERGAKTITSDLKGQTSMDAAKVWDRLMEKHPGEITKFVSKAGSPGYRWSFEEKPELSPALSGKLPPQPRLPDEGTYPAIKTDDGGIYFDPQATGRTHIMFAKDQGIPAERIVSGGWLKDGEYEGSERSDAGRYGEQARAKIRAEQNRKEELNPERMTNGKTKTGSETVPNRSRKEVRTADLGNAEVNAAKEGLNPALKVPPERTTGNPEHDAAIKEGGGIPGGVMKGDASIGVPELTLFHDKTSGTTLALRTDEGITPEKVKAHLEESRAKYMIAASPKFPTYTKAQMIKEGADGYLSSAIKISIPLDMIEGHEPVPATEGGYKEGTPVTQPIEVSRNPESGKYTLYSGNHRVQQAIVNGQSSIPAFVEGATAADLKKFGVSTTGEKRNYVEEFQKAIANTP